MDAFRKHVYKAQTDLVSQLEAFFGDEFQYDRWQSLLGEGVTAYCQGAQLEKAGVLVSCVQSEKLPQSASLQRSHLAGHPFAAVGLSVILHPYHPLLPTAHMNIRCIQVTISEKEKVLWLGGGLDLTPYFCDQTIIDCWHQGIKDYLRPYGEEFYPTWKKACDEYFYLPHRDEPRGIGGIFFDDLVFSENNLNLVQGIPQLFGDLYMQICSLYKKDGFIERQKNFQEWRRGRYVEFNLLYDRGTHFGLQSKGRSESILISLPKSVSWLYQGNEVFSDENQSLVSWLKKAVETI